MTRRIGVVGAAVAALVLSAGPAWGHAAFQNPQRVAANSDQTVTLEVPEERGPDLHNAKVAVRVPSQFAVKSCQAPGGWTCTTGTSASGPVITYSGTGAAEDFAAVLHTPPRAGDYAFKVAQTYSDSKVVAWEGPETSDHPAPILTVTADQPGMHDGMGGGMAASCSPHGTTLQIAAKDNHFDKDCLAVPAGAPFTIVFDNQDAVPHNIVIHRHGDEQHLLFRGDLVTGPKSVTYSVGPLPAGTYHFHCEVHPTTMMGTFVVASADGAPPPMQMGAPAAGPATGAAPAAPPMKMAPAPTPTAGPASARSAASAAAMSGAATAPASARPSTATAAAPLPRTGPATTRLLLPLSGLALMLGGLAIAAGAGRSGGQPV